ncbi:MAG: HAMP domain-containing histidine kinase [Lactobacillales bacterium]|jgi:signal transduction histidine kinase|nr:HAMP domain-containing histidine kinase [Lactobacillales bacterium]
MEISELLAEGIFTILIMLLLNIAVVMVLSMALNSSAELVDIVFSFKQWFVAHLDSPIFYSWQKFLIILLLLIDIWVVYWRLKRRYRQMLLRHIISELHYISMGNYDHRIPFELNDDLGNVVDSINSLVDSTVHAIEDERRIEKSKDELISNVSHDIRTPLTSIIGYLGLIEDKQYHNEEDLTNYTHIAFVKAKQMKILVDDLFEYTKVRQPTANLSFSSFDMTSLMEQLAVDFELEASKKNITINVTSTPEHVIMEGDTEKLVRVFNNLLSNALKYGQGATQIIMDVEKIGSEAIITVRNNGAEIPRENLDQLFDRFYRVEESRSQETGGAGLGLAIAQSIVSLHGGYIFADSNEHWTSFVMHLPLSQTRQ